MSNLTALILLLIWYFANGREQIGVVKTRFGKTYPRRGWAMPLLIALGVFVAFMVVIFVIAIAITAAQGEI